MRKLFYLSYYHEDGPTDIWEVDGLVARCVYYPFPNVTLKEGESLLDALKRKSLLGELDHQVWKKECLRKVGEYYPRIYWPK